MFSKIEVIFMQNKLNEINYWKYNISDGFIVLAGKTAEDNEILSLKIAKPNDVHSRSGDFEVISYYIIPMEISSKRYIKKPRQ